MESGAAGTVGMGSYKGVFTLTEKIKVGKNRIRVAAISPAARNEPDISGGYVFRINHPRASLTSGSNGICHCVFDQTNNMPFQLVDPDWDTLDGGAGAAFSGYLRGYLQEFFDAVKAGDFKNPATGSTTRSTSTSPASSTTTWSTPCSRTWTRSGCPPTSTRSGGARWWPGRSGTWTSPRARPSTISSARARAWPVNGPASTAPTPSSTPSGAGSTPTRSTATPTTSASPSSRRPKGPSRWRTSTS